MKRFFMLVMSIVLTLSVIVALKPFVKTVKASENIILTPEMYTDSDQLLNEDGTKNPMNITGLRDKILSSTCTDDIWELSKAIPAECLRSDGTERDLYYFGKEYGYYVRHRLTHVYLVHDCLKTSETVPVMEIMLIDFNYDDKVECVIGMKVDILFSETFYYDNETGKDRWRRLTNAESLTIILGNMEYFYPDFSQKIEIHKPSFSTDVLNRNELNYGDEGYRMGDDRGAVILQSRLNYTVWKRADNKEEVADAFCKQLVSFAVSLTHIKYVTSILSYTLQISDWMDVILEAGKWGYEGQNNEENIIDYPDKKAQYQKNRSSYLRSIIVSPADQYVYGAKSSLQHIVRLERDAGNAKVSHRFHFVLGCTDEETGDYIFLNPKDEKGNMVYLSGGRDFAFCSEPQRVEVKLDTQESLYILPGGEQTYVFQPYSSGKFLITVPIRAWFSVTDHATGEEIQFSLVPDRTTEKSRSYTAELNKQTEYLLTVNGNEQIIDHIRITFTPKKLPRKQSIVSFKDEKEKYFALDAVDSYYYLTKSDASLNMQLLDENLNLIASLDNSYEFYAENKVRYLFLFYAHENTSNVKMELWERKRISFYGSGVDEPQWIVNTDLSFILPTLSREGYIFEGWYFNSRYDGEKATPESVCAYAGPDVNLYAQWKIDSKKIYQINYVIPDTVYDDKNEIIDTSLIEFQNRIDSFKVTDEVILPILNSEAYNFMGWYTDSDFKNKITKIPQGTIGNKTLYAKIELKEFIISFDLNGGSGDVASQHVKYGKEIQLPTVSRAGYAGNWNAWNGEKSNFGYGYTVYKTETLRAVWRKIYNITYHNVNSRGIVYLHYEKEDAYLKQYYFSDINFDLSRIDVRVSEGKRSKCLRFSGWYTNSELSDPIARIQKGRTGNINLYAKWAFSVSETHTKEQRVTDADHFSQVTDNNLFYLGRMAEMYQSDLKAFGLKKFRFTVSFDMKEENNGNQFMFVFNSKYKEYAKCFYYKGYEYGGVKIDKTYSHVSESFEMSITEFDNDFYVLFGANGAGADDWYYKNLTLKIESIE